MNGEDQGHESGNTLPTNPSYTELVTLISDKLGVLKSTEGSNGSRINHSIVASEETNFLRKFCVNKVWPAGFPPLSQLTYGEDTLKASYLLGNGLYGYRTSGYVRIRGERTACSYAYTVRLIQGNDGFRQDLQILRRTGPRFISYITARWLDITRKWAVHAQPGMVHFGGVSNNRQDNANGCLKDRAHQSDTLGHAIQRFFLACFQTHQRWLSDYNVPEKGVTLTLLPRPRPTGFDSLRKQLNRVMDKLQGLEPRKATASLKQLLVHWQILLCQGSNSAVGGLLSVVEDSTTQPRWRSRDTEVDCCVLCDRPTTTSDRWFATGRVSYHAECCDGESCPLCCDALQAYPKGKGVLATRSTKRTSYEVDPDRSTESQHVVSRKSVCVRVFGSKEELLDSR
ncbi:hypothetical protein CLF_111686 [Clonorchis sinensis]|uniref:Uncharacterized protein n=1 Tax=Clonorchis sinensis TaxID=79923 RepID=G7YLW7_CLOSI|nr:hypothetical protein CLF_111686 [Clonorchis sinensis]